MQEVLEHNAPALTARDRCDRCGTGAQVRATMNTGDLLLCGHHFKRYQPLLEESALSIYSEMEW